MDVTREELVQAIKWKLGIQEPGYNKKRLCHIWNLFEAGPDFQKYASQVAHDFAAIFEEFLKQRLGLPNDYTEGKNDLIYFNKVIDGLTLIKGEDPFLCFAKVIKAALENKDLFCVGSDHEPSATMNSESQPLRDKRLRPTNPSTKVDNLIDNVTELPDRGTNMPEEPGKPAKIELPTYPESSLEPVGKDKLHELADIWKPGQTPEPDSAIVMEAPVVSEAGEPDAAASADPAVSTDSIQEAPLLAPLGQWNYLPIPEGPDNHEEAYAETIMSLGGFKLTGARVRGRSHKHLGTNCDDWFEFTVQAPWTIIAVSDGAGSKKFSRVGSMVSCQAAVAHLAEVLEDHRIEEREIWSVETFQRNAEDGTFISEDLEFVQKALHQAMLAAYGAVERAATERANSLAHYKLLENREITIADLSATLLIAVHTLVNYKGSDYSFVLTCQVGDGMLAAMDRQGHLQLLAVPDTGEYAGQTEFLTNRSKLDRMNLMRKTFPYFRPMRALMVMTDGLADPQAEHIPYYPNDPGMLYLYADLLLNGIIEFKGFTDEAIAKSLEKTKLNSLEEIAKVDFYYKGNTVKPGEVRSVNIRSAALLAKQLGVSISELSASLEILYAGARGEPIWRETATEARLLEWLDCFYAKGENDDRTLVVLYREELP